jgi:hypothetical protein
VKEEIAKNEQVLLEYHSVYFWNANWAEVIAKETKDTEVASLVLLVKMWRGCSMEWSFAGKKVDVQARGG